MLRKLDSKYDHFIQRYGDYAHAAGAYVAVSPQAARRIEFVAKPVTLFGKAGVIGMDTNLSNSPVQIAQIDSFNSADTVNYPGGLYTNSNRSSASGLGCKVNAYVNAPISSISGGTLWRNLYDDGGTVPSDGIATGTDNNTTQVTVPLVTTPS